MTWDPCQPMDVAGQLFACVLTISFKVNKVYKWQKDDLLRGLRKTVPQFHMKGQVHYRYQQPELLYGICHFIGGHSFLSVNATFPIAVWNPLNPLLGLKSF